MLKSASSSLGSSGSVTNLSAAAPRTVDARHGVELPDVERRGVERGNRAGVVEKRIRVADVGAERELKRDVLDGVAVVVDHDFVEHVVVELEEVWAAVRRLERN